MFNSQKVCARVALVFQPTRESRVKNPLGSLLGKNSSFSSWLTGELVLILPMEGSCLLHGEISSQLKKGCLYALDLPPSGGGGGHSVILYFTGDLVDDLNSQGGIS